MIVEQPVDWPLCPQSQARNYRRALKMPVDAPYLLVSEDDVDLPAGRPDAMSAFMAMITESELPVVTLYLPGRRFYPAKIQRQVDNRGRLPLSLFQIVNLVEWFGAQCLCYRQDIARALAWAPDNGCGFDIVLRSWLQRERMPLWGIIPNLVQHRAPRSVTSRRYRAHYSRSFAGATDE